ncbi:unnamed protein product [Tilletia controversa]|nr:unnamed protein product [Tilletia controversa]
MPSLSGTASAPGPRSTSPSPSLSFSTNRTPTSSYFEDGRTASLPPPPPAVAAPSAQPAQSPTSSTDEAAAAYFFVQQLQRHQQQQQQQQQQQRLYASAPSSPGLHPLRPLSRPTTARSRSGSSSSSSARAARSRAGSNASSTTSLHSLSFASQPVPTSSLSSLPPALFPLTPLSPSLHHHHQQQQQQQLQLQQYLAPPLVPPLHDDLPPSYSAAIGAVASSSSGSSSSRTAPSRRSTTDETFGVPGTITTSPGPGSGASTPSAHPSRRASLFQYQNQHQQRVANGDSSHLEGMAALSGRSGSRPASVSDQQQQQRTPRSSRPSSSHESQPQPQQQRRSVPMFSLTAMNGPSGRAGAGVCAGNNSSGTTSRDGGHATTSSSSYHANSNGGGRRRLQSRSEVDLPHIQHGHGHGRGQGYEQEHHGLRYRQRASTSSASALPTLQDGQSQTSMMMSGGHPRAGCVVPVRAQVEEPEVQGEAEGALSLLPVRSRTRPSEGSARRVRASTSTDPTPPARPVRTLLRTLLKPTQSVPRVLLHLLLLPIWALTSVPHSHQAVVDAQPWGARVLLFPLRLFAAVPGCVGTFWLVRNVGVRLGVEGVRSLGRVWEGGGDAGREGKDQRQDDPTAVVFAIASLWSLSTAYYALSLTTLLLRRWLLYYSLPSSIIRLVALQAICWPLVRITLFVFGSQRPLEAWILIASTTAVSDVVARWLVSNIVDRVDGLGAWVGEGEEEEGQGTGLGRAIDARGAKRNGTRRRRQRRRGQREEGGMHVEDDVGGGALPTGPDGIEAELCDLTPTMDDGIKDDTTSTSSDDGSALGSGSADEEEFLRLLSDDLPVRRVFHWDVAIKRNILPMGVLAYASLWVLLASSKVEGRGR